MAPSTQPDGDGSARNRLEKELQDENQRIKEACLQLTDIDPQAEPGRYEALVCAMVDALDRQVAQNSGAARWPSASLPADLFDGMGVEPGALNALMAQLRSLSKGDGASSNRFEVLNDYVNQQPARNPEQAPASGGGGRINWEDLAERLDALRRRLYREAEEDRPRSPRQRSVGSAAPAGSAAASSGDLR